MAKESYVTAQDARGFIYRFKSVDAVWDGLTVVELNKDGNVKSGTKSSKGKADK